MKKLFLLTILALFLEASQSIQIWSAPNKNGKITPQTIEAAFNKVGLDVLANNDMNKPFRARFHKTHYPVYNLAIFIDNTLTYHLLKKYPQFGVLSPMTMSIWVEDETINVATLSFIGMSRVTKVPPNDKYLRRYAAKIQQALRLAMPKGRFKKTYYQDKEPQRDFLVSFTQTVDEEVSDPAEIEENFEDEFTGELEGLGFLFPSYLNIKEDIFDEFGFKKYDFFNTLSICKFDVIFPVSKRHPEVGAYAPCTFYIYKKKNEKTMHMGFLGVENWITTANITDSASLEPLKKAQNTIVTTLKAMIE